MNNIVNAILGESSGALDAVAMIKIIIFLLIVLSISKMISGFTRRI